MKYTFPASTDASASASASASATASSSEVGTAEASLVELEHIHLLLEERLPIQEESQTEDSQS